MQYFNFHFNQLQTEKKNIESISLTNWSSIQNTTRPRPEGGEDEESKPSVDGLSNPITMKVMKYLFYFVFLLSYLP